MTVMMIEHDMGVVMDIFRTRVHGLDLRPHKIAGRRSGRGCAGRSHVKRAYLGVRGRGSGRSPTIRRRPRRPRHDGLRRPGRRGRITDPKLLRLNAQ